MLRFLFLVMVAGKNSYLWRYSSYQLMAAAKREATTVAHPRAEDDCLTLTENITNSCLQIVTQCTIAPASLRK